MMTSMTYVRPSMNFTRRAPLCMKRPRPNWWRQARKSVSRTSEAGLMQTITSQMTRPSARPIHQPWLCSYRRAASRSSSRQSVIAQTQRPVHCPARTKRVPWRMSTSPKPVCPAHRSEEPSEQCSSPHSWRCDFSKRSSSFAGAQRQRQYSIASAPTMQRNMYRNVLRTQAATKRPTNTATKTTSHAMMSSQPHNWTHWLILSATGSRPVASVCVWRSTRPSCSRAASPLRLPRCCCEAADRADREERRASATRERHASRCGSAEHHHPQRASVRKQRARAAPSAVAGAAGRARSSCSSSRSGPGPSDGSNAAAGGASASPAREPPSAEPRSSFSRWSCAHASLKADAFSYTSVAVTARKKRMTCPREQFSRTWNMVIAGWEGSKSGPRTFRSVSAPQTMGATSKLA
mmetsp:Transcript_59728/g.187379  ORF Transcript_59728/g.187379 Transcript_59728/m.187379 type:complete len:407 (-) Transcript_59728:830-2050(-)